MAENTNSMDQFPRPLEDSKQQKASSTADTQPVKVTRQGKRGYPAPQQDITSENMLSNSLADTQPTRAASKRGVSVPASPAARTQARSLQVGDQPFQTYRSSGLWKDAWQRLLRNPEAVIGLVIITLFVLVAICADWLAPYSLKETHIKMTNLPPAWVSHSKLGYQGNPDFLLGTDRNGRDLLSWAIYGTRSSMVLGVISAPLIALFGLVIGLVSGYVGGWLDNIIMRITDVFYAFPTIMITILVVLVLRNTAVGKWQNGLLMLFIAFLSVGWAGAARLVRGSVLMIKDREYIEAARCIGVPAPRLVFKHILPNCLSPLLVWITLMVPQLILIEAVLGYLQINIGPVGYGEAFFDSSWGGMIREGRSFIHVQPITLLIPAICIGLVSIAFTYLGDSLRDALDPQNGASKS